MTGNRGPGAPGLTSALALMVVCGLLAAPRTSATVDSSKPRIGSSKPRPASNASLRSRPRSRSTSTTPLRFRLESAENSSEAVHDGRRIRGRFTVKVNVQNLNDRPVTISGIGRNGPGLRLLSPLRRPPRTLQPEQTSGFELKYRVTGCGAVPVGDWPIPIRVKANGGERTAYAPLTMTAVNPVNDEDEGESDGQPWQTVLTAQVCDL